jgi:hypothetical protein
MHGQYSIKLKCDCVFDGFMAALTNHKPSKQVIKQNIKVF